MGYRTEFNWVLKLSPEQGFPRKIEKGQNYLFEKQEERIYPIGMPIDLLDKEWAPHAKVIIEDLVITENKTRGNFKVIYIYSKKEKTVLFDIIKETVLKYKEK